MWSVDDYATQIYRYASSEVCAHVVRTVLQPLGLADTECAALTSQAYLALFALPPYTTNVRLCGARLRARSAALQAALKEEQKYHTDAVYAPVHWLTELGLPYAAVVLPRRVTSSSSSSSPALTRSSLWSPDTDAGSRSHAAGVWLCVDTGCAEAVLRGSDVYAAGVLASSRAHFEAGTRVRLLWLAQRCEGAACAVRAAAVTAGSSLARMGVLDGIAYARKEEDVSTEERCTTTGEGGGRDVLAVCLGEGRAVQDAKTIRVQAQRGVAIAMTHNPRLQPSQQRLATLFAAATRAEKEEESVVAQPAAVPSSPFLFLQNYSSMVPVQLLVERLLHHHNNIYCESDEPMCVLDACAAPGGKSSLLLSLLLEQPRKFTLVCCERSASRCEQLRRCLTSHFAHTGEDEEEKEGEEGGLLARVLRVCDIDVNKLELQGGCEAVLLDPPCTGMGLRPRLVPHGFTIAQITAAADYQRKLFDSCLRLLTQARLPRSRCSRCCQPSNMTQTLVYSTCTITCEENEGNVLAFLTRYEHVRLARARTAEERALCALSTTNYPTGPRFLLQEEITAVQRQKEQQEQQHGRGIASASDEDEDKSPLLVLRFMPRSLSQYASAYEDGVGFFVAVFEVGCVV